MCRSVTPNSSGDQHLSSISLKSTVILHTCWISCQYAGFLAFFMGQDSRWRFWRDLIIPLFIRFHCCQGSICEKEKVHLLHCPDPLTSCSVLRAVTTVRKFYSVTGLQTTFPCKILTRAFLHQNLTPLCLKYSGVYNGSAEQREQGMVEQCF